MTVVVIFDNIGDERVKEEIGRARAAVFVLRRGKKEKKLYRECKSLARKIGLPYRVITLDSNVVKSEMLGLGLAIGKFYTGNPDEKVVLAEQKIVVG